ncbi:hypothetical protein Y032_0032g2542 [Ancylostoma ceylanicum]|uniref:ZP domain-containing protein n=1 Tax=Ancylostoma ceylanicum TaxID=53326 RepID=A0A016UPS1_9BILA|nr:hypothetical protein Y032_0032g2542 [Ancylostoma ceylanicum]
MNLWILAVLLFAGTEAGERKTSNDPLEDWMFTQLKQCDNPPPVHEGDTALFNVHTVHVVGKEVPVCSFRLFLQALNYLSDTGVLQKTCPP